jgi:hypothetical protein
LRRREAFGIAAVALCLYGVGTSTGNVTYNTALQKNVSDRLRGRAFATYDIIWQTFRLVSLAAGGVLADEMDITMVYVVGGALLIAAALIGSRVISPHGMSARVG